MKNIIVETPAKVRAGMAFTLKGDRKRYMAITAHRDGSVTFAAESDVSPKGISMPYIVAKGLTVKKLSKDDFAEAVSNFIESNYATRIRTLSEIRDAEIAAENLEREIEVAWTSAIIEDVIFDVKNGGDIAAAVLYIENVVASAHKAGYNAGREDGYDSGHEDGYDSGREDASDDTYLWR